MKKQKNNTRGKYLRRLALLLSCVILQSNVAFAQNITFKYSDTPLITVLKEIQKQTDYKFVYNNNLINVNQKVTVDVDKANINQVMSKLLADTGIDFKIIEKQITLSPKQFSEGQRKNIVGLIYDEQGDPLPGVYVQSASGKTAVSDLNGNFSIPAGDKEMLTFSFLGMEKLTLAADSRRRMNVGMKSDMVALEDVVVTGYQTISKERATGSFNIVKGEQLEKPSVNIAERLIGTTAGVQSTVDADGGVSFEIRGQTSLLANAQPLLVVDGFPTQDSFSSINPNDVESVSILKDAAAASIWGARSANGVIVVVTKKGANAKKGDVKVDVSTMWKYSPKIDWSYANPLATSAETIEYETIGYGDGNGFFGSAYWMPAQDTYEDYSGMSLATTAMNEYKLGYISESEMKATLSKLAGQNNSDQIKKYMLDNPFTQQYNVNITSATERSTNVLSLMYEHQDKYLKCNSDNKYNVGYRTTVKLFKWLDFSFNGNFNQTNSINNATSYSDIAALSPYQMLANEDGSLIYDYAYAYDYYGYNYSGALYGPNIERHVPTGNFPYSDWKSNLISDRDGRDYRTRRTSVRAQAGLTFHIIDGLTFDSKFQYENIESYTKNINDESTIYVRYAVNTASTWDKTTNKVTANLPKGGIMNQSKSSVSSYNWRNQANFDRNFDGDKHQVSAIVGTEVSNIVNQGTNYSTTYGYNDDKLTVGTFPNGVGGSGNLRLYNWMGGTQTFGYTNSYSYKTERYFSLYANASYTFDKKYTISGSARTDASNLITDDPKYRYAPFWSVGLSWNATNESFMSEVDWLDRLVVRATYGYNGNVDRSTSFMPLINVSTTQNTYIQDFTASVSSYGNPTLRWEKTGTFDFGFDFSALKGKLFGKLDLYNKKGEDLVVSMSIPSVNGTSSQKMNAAEMTNRGVEVELGSSLNILDRDIVWNGSLNFSYNYNRIDKLFKTTYAAYELYGGGTSAYVQGYDANTLWSFEYAGIRNVGTEANPKYRPVVQGTDGDVYDFTGWTPGDGRDYLLHMGTKVAPFSLGFSSNFKIYDFNVSFMFTGKFGHVFNGYSFNYDSMTGGQGLPNKLYSEVVNADPNKMVPIPTDGETRYYFWDRFYPYLDYLVQSANHIRCQEVSVSYNVPRRFLQHLRLSKATLYAQANNLFVITNNKYDEDPEYTLGSIKPTPSYTFGVNFTF